MAFPETKMAAISSFLESIVIGEQLSALALIGWLGCGLLTLAVVECCKLPIDSLVADRCNSHGVSDICYGVSRSSCDVIIRSHVRFTAD